jgi:hypothetical protein
MANVPQWQAEGDWFDVCKCDIPCPCEFAQPPTGDECDGILAWHIGKGSYGGVPLDGLNVLAIGYYKGNIWEGAKAAMGIFLDERADAKQREALQMIFGGQAGGWPGQFAQNIAEVRGIEFARALGRASRRCSRGDRLCGWPDAARSLRMSSCLRRRPRTRSALCARARNP